MLTLLLFFALNAKASLFQMEPLPNCRVMMDRQAFGADQYMIVVRGVCDVPETRSLKVTLNDGLSLKKIDCPEHVEVTTLTQDLCQFPISLESSAYVRVAMDGQDEARMTEVFRKAPTHYEMPKLRILSGSRLSVDATFEDGITTDRIQWVSEIRALVKDVDVDHYSTGYNRVDLILKTGSSTRVISSVSASALQPEVRFEVGRLIEKGLLGTEISGDLDIGENTLFLRVYDGYGETEFVDSDVFIVTLRDSGA